MSTKTKETLTVISQEEIGRDIFSLWLQTDQMAQNARPGQFLSLYTGDGSKLLPRPISICEIDKEDSKIRLVYRVTGKNTGTEGFSRLKPGEKIEALGPLGNGFPLEEAAEKTAVLGYRDELFLNDEFTRYADVYVATEDGSAGTKGNVLNAICERGLEAEVIFACGPTPMLRALKEYAAEKNITCWISMEERMACGIGACLGCVCKSKEIDAHSLVHNKRVCKDGPVFLSTEVEL